MIIDIECDIPTREVYEADIRSYDGMEDHGLGNYINIFGPKWASDVGMSPDEFEEMKRKLGPAKLRKMIEESAMKDALTEEEFIHIEGEEDIKSIGVVLLNALSKNVSSKYHEFLWLAYKTYECFIIFKKIGRNFYQAFLKEGDILLSMRFLFNTNV